MFGNVVFLMLPLVKLTIWAASWQNQQNDCAPSEDSDQPGHPPSLIRVFTDHMKTAWVLSYPLSAQQRLRSEWVDAQADLSLRWAHSHFVGFVMRWLLFQFCCVFASEFAGLLLGLRCLLFSSIRHQVAHHNWATSGENVSSEIFSQVWLKTAQLQNLARIL